MLLKSIKLLYFIDILLLVILFVSKFIKLEKGEKTKVPYIVIRTLIGYLQYMYLLHQQ